MYSQALLIALSRSGSPELGSAIQSARNDADLLAGLEAGFEDRVNESKASKHAHPAERPLVEVLMNARRKLHASLCHCLSTCAASK